MIKNALPVSPQDDHVIEFAKQFGWDPAWMEKQVKKKSKKKLEEEAARFTQDVGEMLGAVSRDAASSASASQVVPHDQSSSGAVLPTQAPQVKAPPPVKATPPAPPSSSVEPQLPLVGASPQATPPEFSTPPPPPRRRSARSEETEAASREDRLAVIARTAQSKAMAAPVRDATDGESRNHVMWRLKALRVMKLVSSRLASSASKSAIHRMLSIPWRHFLVLMCFMSLVWLPGVRRFASLIVLGAQMDAIGSMDIHSSGHLHSPLKCLHVMMTMIQMMLVLGVSLLSVRSRQR